MSSRMAIITFLDGQPVDPGFGVGAPGNRPDNSLPPGYGGGRPDNSLPGGGGITTLPVFPFDPTKPDNELPGGGGNSPDNSLPRPGKKYVVKWLACHGLILVPDNDLPGAPVRPDNSLPGQGGERPDQGLPPFQGRPDQGLPPTPEPKLYGG